MAAAGTAAGGTAADTAGTAEPALLQAAQSRGRKFAGADLRRRGRRQPGRLLPIPHARSDRSKAGVNRASDSYGRPLQALAAQHI